MSQFEDLFLPSTHVCHVCATEYNIKRREQIGYPQPPCCPACDAPMRVSQVPIGKSLSYSVLLGLGGAPIDSFDDSWYRKLTEFRVLQHARTYADINAIMDELRAVFPRLRTITPCGAVSPSNDPYQVSKTAAQNRLREQLDSGLLEWRLNDLREQTIALLRAEHEHHRYVHAVRRGQ